MKEMGVVIRRKGEGWFLALIIVGRPPEEWPCQSEKEGEARGARAKMAAEEMMRAMGLHPDRIGLGLFTLKPTQEQYDCIVDVIRLHLSGAL